MVAAARYNAVFQLARLTDRTLGHLLDCLTEIDTEQLELNQSLPLLYESGVRYYHDKRDDPWMDVLSILAAHARWQATGVPQVIDCEDLACWRAAELRVRFGIFARPVFERVRVQTPDGVKQYVHILVQYPDGRTEDPSRRLGMTTPGEFSLSQALADMMKR